MFWILGLIVLVWLIYQFASTPRNDRSISAVEKAERWSRMG